MLNVKRILVVAAHPDDEMLGCGGTLARLRAGGAEVEIVLLGEGPTSRTIENKTETRLEAGSSARAAAEVLNIRQVHLAGLPDNRFDSLPLLEIVQTLEPIVSRFQPELVFTHHWGDLNIDHRLTHQAVMTAFRPLPGTGSTTVLAFEVPSSTEYCSPSPGNVFIPNVFIDIIGFLEQKQKALKAYASEMRAWPHPRSHEGVTHLAHLRGCQCGVEAAEAFVLCRSVQI